MQATRLVHSDIGLLNELLKRSGFHCLLIAALSAIILFGSLRRGDLSGYDDAAYAHEGRQMARSGDWFQVRLNGYLNFDKPPLFVWCEAAFFKILGISDFAAKFPSALFGLGTILLVYFIAREMAERLWPPIIAMLVMATTQYFMKYAMHAMTCVTFTFFFSLAILSYLRGFERQRYWLLCGAATGLAALTRSPVGLLPLFIIMVHLLIIRRSRLLWSKYMAGCFLIALLLPGLWYWSQYQRYGSQFLAEHFGNLMNHAVSSRNRDWAHFSLGLLEYPYLLFKLYWPWLPFVIVGFLMQFQKMAHEREPAASLLVIWVLSVLVPFSFVETKVLRYILPAFPAFSILSAIALERYGERYWKAINLRIAYAFLFLTATLMTVFASYRLRARDMQRLAPVAEAATLPDQRIVLYNFGDPRADYRSQLIWYGDRLCEQTEDLNTVKYRLLDPRTVVIMDKSTFPRLAQQRAIAIEILGESENFVCFRSREHGPRETGRVEAQ